MAAARQRPAPARHAAAGGRRAATTRSCTRAPAGSTCRCCRPRTPASYCAHGPGEVARRTRRPARRGRHGCRPGVRVRTGGQPRESARRDHAAGAEPAHRARRSSAAVRRCPRAAPVSRARRCWCPAGRSSSASTAAEEPLSLDNERDAHVVDVPSFRIGRVPVTNAEWRDFIDDGGYREPRWWSDARLGASPARPDWSAPKFWNADGTRTRFGHVEDIPGRRARAARDVLRSRGVRRVGGRAAAHRDGVGEGVRLGSRRRVRRRRFPWGASEPTECAGQPRR